MEKRNYELLELLEKTMNVKISKRFFESFLESEEGKFYANPKAVRIAFFGSFLTRVANENLARKNYCTSEVFGFCCKEERESMVAKFGPFLSWEDFKKIGNAEGLVREGLSLIMMSMINSRLEDEMFRLLKVN